jgi:hypothetical protein
MTSTLRLRLRLLSALSGSVLVACSGNVTESKGGSDAGSPPPTCSAPKSARHECFDPGTNHFYTGGLPLDAQPPRPTPQFDQNGCQVHDQVRDGCCNPALCEPDFVDGKCCYAFSSGACCGRPLFAGGEPLLAALEQRGDWLDPELVAKLGGDASPGESALLAKAWLEDARMEHASIASFARFALDLLAFGAPAELVEAAQRAMGDEIRHARLCFSIAAAYSKTPLGPGPIPLDGVRPSIALAEAAAAAVREGCIGETVAALMLEQQAQSARSPALRAILRELAADEANHAELAWKFVRWALMSGGSHVRAAVEAAFRHAALPGSTGGEPDACAWRAHGRLARGDIEGIGAAALREVIAPCARALGAVA